MVLNSARQSLIFFLLWMQQAHAALLCAGKRDEYQKGCSAILDAVACEAQLACFLVDSSACVGDLAKFGAVDYGVSKVNFMLPKSRFFTSVTQRAAEFQICTGVQIDFVNYEEVGKLGWGEVNALVNDDLGTETCSLDVSHGSEEGTQSCVVSAGLGKYDAYLIKTGWVADYANVQLLEPFDDYIRDSGPTLAWNDVHKSIRDNLARYGEEVVVMPVDADFSTMLVREDVLETYKKETGKDILSVGRFSTWDDLVAFVRHMDHRDFDGDGFPDHASCLPRCASSAFSYMALGGPLYMIYASIIQTLGIQQGIHFDPETMKPLFDTDGFALALQLYANLSYPCLESDDNLCQTRPNDMSLYSSGKCVVLFSHPGPVNGRVIGSPIGRKNASGQFVWQPTMSDGVTYADSRRMGLPGSPQVVDRKSKRLVACDGQTCPLAIDGINRSPLINGGNTLAIRRAAKTESKRALKDFFAYLNSPLQSIPDTATPGTWNNHWRASHIAESAWQVHKALGWTREEFSALQEVTADLTSQNPSLELRLRGYTEYVYDTFEPLVRKYFGYEEVANEKGELCLLAASDPVQDFATLASELTERWDIITDKFGRLDQLLRYRKSLGLPSLSHDRLCSEFADQMAGVGLDPRVCLDPFSCIPGTYFNSATRTCTNCTAGTYSASKGQSQCLLCEAGRHADSGGATECSHCLSGRYSAEEGSIHCLECEQGHFSNNVGASTCLRCLQGFYQSLRGQTHCKECHEVKGSSTIIEAATKKSDCKCPQGTYRAFFSSDDPNKTTSKAQCVSCAEGVTCKQFGGMPLVQEGYFMHPSASRSAPQLDVYQCMPSIATICPGQRQDMSEPVCGEHMTGLNCGLCEEGFTRSGNRCTPCSKHAWIFPTSCVVGFFLCGLFHGLWNTKATHVEAGETILGSVTMGLTLGFIQQLGMFDRMQIMWPGGFRYVLELLSVFLFEMDVLAPTCILPQGLATSYGLSMLVPIFLVASLLAWLPVSRLLNVVSFGKIPRFNTYQLLNTTGMIVQAIFISIAASTVRLLECYESPNGVKTIRRYPYAECSREAYWKMMPLCIFGFVFYIFGILCLFTFAAIVAPRKVVSPKFRTSVHFLIFKFCPDRWWYGIFLLLRSLALAMITVIEAEDGFIQFLMMTAILIASLAAHLTLLPYSDQFANNLESAELCTMLAMLGIGSWFISDRNPELEGVLATILIFLFVLSVVLLIGVFLYASFLAQFPDKAKDMHRRRIEVVLPMLKAICSLVATKDEDVIIDMLSKATYIDRNHVYEMVRFMLLELEGVQTPALTRMRLPQLTSSSKIVTHAEVSHLVSSLSVRSFPAATRSSSKKSVDCVQIDVQGTGLLQNTSLESSQRLSHDHLSALHGPCQSEPKLSACEDSGDSSQGLPRLLAMPHFSQIVSKVRTSPNGTDMFLDRLRTAQSASPLPPV